MVDVSGIMFNYMFILTRYNFRGRNVYELDLICLEGIIFFSFPFFLGGGGGGGILSEV